MDKLERSKPERLYVHHVHIGNAEGTFDRLRLTPSREAFVFDEDTREWVRVKLTMEEVDG